MGRKFKSFKSLMKSSLSNVYISDVSWINCKFKTLSMPIVLNHINIHYFLQVSYAMKLICYLLVGQPPVIMGVAGTSTELAPRYFSQINPFCVPQLSSFHKPPILSISAQSKTKHDE